MSALLLADVEVAGRRVDVLVDGGRIAAAALPLPPNTVRVEGDGGALLPGLHDHHMHLRALAAAHQSVGVGPEEVRDRAALASRLADASAALPPGRWLRAAGYHERIAGDLDRWTLDAMVPDRPVRLQHRSGALWILSSSALAAVGLLEGDLPDGCEVLTDGTPTGRLFRLDAWLSGRVPRRPLALAAVSRALLAAGITGITDATPFETRAELELLAAAVRSGEVRQRVTVMRSPALAASDIPPPLEPGPVKLLLPDHELPPMERVIDDMRSARDHGLPVAVHCVTRVALALTIAALDEVGAAPGDRIEHGAVIAPDHHEALRRLGLTVVTQPNFIAERGDDYLADVDVEDRDHLWPAASLIEAGIPVAAGTDAPFGRPDPWALLHAAVRRRAPSGALVGAGERLDAARALDMLLGTARSPGGPSRRVAVGEPADLCLLALPLRDALDQLPANPVRATIIGGQLYE